MRDEIITHQLEMRLNINKYFNLKLRIPTMFFSNPCLKQRQEMNLFQIFSNLGNNIN